MVSYNEILKHKNLWEYDSQKGRAKGQTMTEIKKMESTELNWDEVTLGGKFVTLSQDERKLLVIKNWKLERVNKWGEEQIEFSCDVVEEDEVECEKVWTTTSKRLMSKLKPVLLDRAKDTEVRLSVKKIGDKFDTVYDIELK
jgi:hypothetical protein|tara:strand:+ start:2527 stop:2952 length:426 start_codon:yes stop_codon:yes gene_type:complete